MKSTIKLEKDLENKMRSNDEQLEENITLNTEIENIQTELEKNYKMLIIPLDDQ
jgi:hypothetical protein